MVPGFVVDSASRVSFKSAWTLSDSSALIVGLTHFEQQKQDDTAQRAAKDVEHPHAYKGRLFVP